MELLLGILFGALIAVWGTSSYFKKKKPISIEKEAVILIDKIKAVCKLVSVEGSFSEIYTHESSKSQFLIKSKKKAILLVKANAHIGFDLTQLKLQSNFKTKEILIDGFPNPDVISIDTDVSYFDKTDGLFNKFEAEDLTQLNKEAKKFIRDKIPESGLLKLAEKEALDTLKIIDKLIEGSGWKINYSNIEIPKLPK